MPDFETTKNSSFHHKTDIVGKTTAENIYGALIESQIAEEAIRKISLSRRVYPKQNTFH